MPMPLPTPLPTLQPGSSILMGSDDDNKEIPPCPHCAKPDNVIRNGFRTLKSGPVQIFLCKSCNKQFRGRKMKNVSYPPKILLAAVSLFNTGHTYEQTVTIMKQRYDVELPISTLKSWVDRYTDDFPFIKHRRKYVINPYEVIRTRCFSTAPQLPGLGNARPQSSRSAYPGPQGTRYDFKVHTYKLDLAGKKMPKLKTFINHALDECDDRLFQSEVSGRITDVARHVPTPKGSVHSIHNTPTCKLTLLALELSETKHDRHPRVEEFFLMNDTNTVAIEVPVWLNAEEAWRLGLPGRPITGHINILQVEKNRCLILEYKPDPVTKEYAMTLMDIYAKAFSVRTGIPAQNIQPVYFDEKEYIEVNVSVKKVPRP